MRRMIVSGIPPHSITVQSAILSIESRVAAKSMKYIYNGGLLILSDVPTPLEYLVSTIAFWTKISLVRAYLGTS